MRTSVCICVCMLRRATGVRSVYIPILKRLKTVEWVNEEEDEHPTNTHNELLHRFG